MTPQDMTKARGRYTQLKYAQRLRVSVQTLRNWEQGVSPIPAYAEHLVNGAKTPEWTYALVTADQVVHGTERAFSANDAISASIIEFRPRQLVHQIHEPSRTVYCFETARSVTMPALVYADR